MTTAPNTVSSMLPLRVVTHVSAITHMGGMVQQVTVTRGARATQDRHVVGHGLTKSIKWMVS